MKFSRFLCVLLCTALLCCLFAGCERQDPEPQETALTLRAAVCGPIASLDPTRNTDPAAESVFSALFENLLRLEEGEDGLLSVAPGIAKEYKVSDNLDGTLTYTFTLRNSARWSDGERVRAGDFVYAWQRLVDPAMDNPNHAMLSMVVGYDEVRETGNIVKLSVRTLSNSVFSVTVRDDCPWFLTEVCTSTVTVPLRRNAVDTNPSGWMDSGCILTCGPYKVASWENEDTLVLTKNEEYYGARRVAAERLVFTLSDDEEALYGLYRTDGLDMLAFSGDLALQEGDEVQRLRARETVCLLFNNLSDCFAEESVRAALCDTVDLDATAALLGTQTAAVATALVPDRLCGSEEGVSFREAGGVLLETDAAARTALLAQSMMATLELRFSDTALRLIYPEGETNAALAALLVARWQEQLHVKVEAEGLSAEEYGQRLRAGEYDLALAKIAAASCDALELLAPWQSKSDDNVIGYASSSYDLLLGAAQNSDTAAARMAFLHDAEALLLEDRALLPLAFCTRAWLLRDGLGGLAFSSPDVFRYDGVTRR